MVTRSVNDIVETQIQTATKDAAVLVNGATLFTVTGGPILIKELAAVCITDNDATASTLQFSADGDDGSAVTISGASASLSSKTAGTIVATVPGTLATALAVYNNGIGITGTVDIVVPAGIITAVVGVGSTTGTWKIVMRYQPLTAGVSVN